MLLVMDDITHVTAFINQKHFNLIQDILLKSSTSLLIIVFWQQTEFLFTSIGFV